MMFFEKCECEYRDVECLINCLESTIRTENQRKKRSDDYYSSDCECGDDDACWEDFLQTGECPLTRPEFECECEDWDKECWTFCLECLQTGVCPDRQLLTANLKEKSIFLLELKWSDKETKIVKLESLGDIDEDCFYKGSYIEDSDSTILITGCELKNILIQSPIFGDYLGTITVNGTFKVPEEAPLYDDALENPDWPTVAITEDFALEKCECEYGDVECLINCLESTIQTENQRKKRSDDYYSSDCECGDDDACWEDFLQTGECPVTRPESDYYSSECECGEDDSCWEDFLQTGECPVTHPEFECEEWDKECWKF